MLRKALKIYAVTGLATATTLTVSNLVTYNPDDELVQGRQFLERKYIPVYTILNGIAWPSLLADINFKEPLDILRHMPLNEETRLELIEDFQIVDQKIIEIKTLWNYITTKK